MIAHGMKKLGVGIVGVGYSGREHLKAYESDPRAEVRALYATSSAGLKTMPEKVPLFTSSFDELLGRDDIGVVSVCSPNHLHAGHVVKAIQAGKHVLCEKPLATTLQGCAEILQASAKAPAVKVMVGQILRFSPVFKMLKGMKDRGELGDIFYAESNYFHNVERRIKSWWVSSENVDIALLGGGIHAVDLLRWTVGEIVEVYAVAAPKVLKELPHQDTVVLSLRFAGGSIGKVAVFLGCKRPYSLELSLYGTRGTAIGNRVYLERIEELEDFITLPVRIVPEHPHFAEEISHFLESVVSGTPSPVDARDGARSVAVCIAAARSLLSRRPEPVPLLAGAAP